MTSQPPPPPNVHPPSPRNYKASWFLRMVRYAGARLTSHSFCKRLKTKLWSSLITSLVSMVFCVHNLKFDLFLMFFSWCFIFVSMHLDVFGGYVQMLRSGFTPERWTSHSLNWSFHDPQGQRLGYCRYEWIMASQPTPPNVPRPEKGLIKVLLTIGFP